MRKLLLPALFVALCSVSALADKTPKSHADEILLTIDKTPVTLGEFEYLYHKNNSQQLVPQTIEQYLDLFINYKLKVAEARRAGLDTLATFRTELDGYARELAEPYLVDTIAEKQLINDLYNRMKEEVNVSHIMLPTGDNLVDLTKNRATADSLRQVLLNGGNFEQLAATYSIDRNSAMRGGNMGFIPALRFPYVFEDAAYNTPVGSISDVIMTPFGYHIVKPIARRPSPGEVLVQHILVLTQDLEPAEVAQKRARIDSIHALLVNGASFDDLATRFSEDPGSARQGGRLPWFSTGRMVKPFEEMSFNIANGEISPVFETSYGYHIVRRLDWRGVDSLQNVIPAIKEAISRDERSTYAKKARINELKKAYHLTDNRPARAMVESVIRSAGGYDSSVIARFASMPAVLVSMDNGPAVILNQAIKSLAPMDGVDPERAIATVNARIDALAAEAVEARAIAEMPITNPDYRNLLNEYRDGILLFEISDRNVWSRAKEDAAGLDNWFKTHRDRYTWEKPKFKSHIIFATSDSILDGVNQYLANNKIDPALLQQTLGSLFGTRNIRVERVIAAKGENAIVDYLGFGGEKPKPTGKWVAYRAFNPVILEAPVEVADERGAITADYQSHLEEKWIKQLHKTHKVKVNRKVLKKAQ